jgi:signal transduction histidine kinase
MRTDDEGWPAAQTPGQVASGGAAQSAGRRESPGSAADVADGLLAYIEHSPAAIVIADGRSLEIRYANPAFERLCDPDDGSMHALLLTHAIPPAAGEALVRLLDSMQEDDDARCEAEITSGRGEPGMADWRIAISRVPCTVRRPCDVVVEIRDISREQREQRDFALLLDQLKEVNSRLLESSLREADLAAKAEAASDAKSTFLATMSHELRTPLTAIIGYEELLADGIFGPVTQVQRMHLARVKSSASHLLDLIDQILTLARVDAGRETVQLAPLRAVEVVDWTATIIDPLARAKGLTFATHLTDEALTLQTDAIKVRQILVNLLGNSVKFTDRGEVTLTVEGCEETVRFVIRDTGIGIAPDDLERIFGSFWQVEQRQTRKVGGSGLGLSVSRHLARLLGGDIVAESILGVGSVFTVTLPRDSTAAP